IVVTYVGSSLLSPLKQAERDIKGLHKLDLNIAAYNCGGALDDSQWSSLAADMADADIVFIIHVTDSDSANRIISLLAQHKNRHHAVIAINCMPDLMRQTRLGKLDLQQMMKPRDAGEAASGRNLLKKLSTWMASFAKARAKSEGDRKTKGHDIGSYRKLINKLT